MFSYKTTKCHFQNKPFSTLFKFNQNMTISTLSLKSIKIYKNQHQASSTHTLTLSQTQTYLHIIYSSSCQFSTTSIPLNHHCTQSISYSPSTWFHRQFNHNQSSSIYHNMHISHTSYHQGINNHHHIYDHIIYFNHSTTSTIQCLS